MPYICFGLYPKYCTNTHLIWVLGNAVEFVQASKYVSEALRCYLLGNGKKLVLVCKSNMEILTIKKSTTTMFPVQILGEFTSLASAC